MAKDKIPTKEQLQEEGKSLREKCPRGSHGEVILGQREKRGIVAFIEKSNEDRLENLGPIRHGRMLQSPFAYLRGTALIQAGDLAGTPSSGILVHACSDCHLLNFGGFATPERIIIFDISDFDETLPALFEWDLKRLAASSILHARWRRFRPGEAREMAIQAASSYRDSMRERARNGVLEAWYSRITLDDVLKIAPDADSQGRVKKQVAAARKQTHEHLFHKFTGRAAGLPRIVDHPPLLYDVDKQLLSERVLADFFKQYRETLAEERRMLFDQFKLVDLALKVVGVGSIGTRGFVALLLATLDSFGHSDLFSCRSPGIPLPLAGIEFCIYGF